MRTRKLLAGATFLTLGLGAASQANAQLLMKGSDTLEDITKDAVSAAGLSAVITYVGGGTTGGQAAMTASPPTQQIAPMSRQLNGTACTTLGATVGQELIGLDGLSMVGANQTQGDSDDQSASTADNCNDNITGGLVLNVPGCTANDGCDASSNYTFADWKDVLAMVYGGQNHNTTLNGNPNPQLVSGARNPTRINCNSPVRRALVDNWGNLFQAGTGAQSCRTPNCTKLRHAFRRDDISGTTDTFVGLVGLVGIPAYTTAFDPTPTFLPKPDAAAAANPFCNAGEGKMNKGDADYLDLDPIRRSVDHTASGVRPPLEQVGEAGLPAFGGNNNDANCAPPAPGIPTNSASSSVPNLLPSHVIAGSQALLQDELGFPGGGSAALRPITRTCLGLVLPIAMPGNYTAPEAYFGASEDGATPPVPCSIDPVTGTPVMVNKILDTTFTASLCSDGKTQPCRVPVNNSTGTNNFNCYLDALNPAILPFRDNRGFHLHPVTNAGLYKRDNYVNPNIPVSGGIPAARQNRVVTAFYRLHFSHTTNINGSVPTLAGGQFCKRLSATNQIGCLVKANACSIGFAGREAVDPFTVAGGPRNMAFRIRDLAASVANVEALFTTPSTADDYPLSRGLYVNSVKGFANVTGDELTLLNFLRTPASIDPIVAARNFIVVPASVTRSSGCPRP
jgi:ABC-type phosphate transport system substrate-binding protein